MALRIFNSLTREKEEFQPLHPPRVNFYNCGPTVYGEFHIGNARNFVVVDVIRRWLMARGYQVTYAQNITDVDDKIIDRARRENTTSQAIAEKYTAYFLAKLKELGNLPADFHPKATQHIGPMIGLIERLIERGHAYPSEDGSVWYEVGTFREYGKLSRMPLDQMQVGERVDSEQQRLKRSPMDFALWKAAKPTEPFWHSPWGKGRPGWHIECSCMAMKTFQTETIDIHAGGADLRFPHHENEIAQSEGATGKPFARFWVHNGMLDIDGAKMSKSLGNIKSIDDVLAVVDPLTLRYFLISARYRDKLDFTDDNLHKCRSAMERTLTAAREARHSLNGITCDNNWKSVPALLALWEDFAEGMDDDFNTPRALGAMAQATTALNTARMEHESRPLGPPLLLSRTAALLMAMREALGLGRELERNASVLDADLTERLAETYRALAPDSSAVATTGEQWMEHFLALRANARKAKNFALADEVRKRLTELGIVVEDKKDGTIWRKA